MEEQDAKTINSETGGSEQLTKAEDATNMNDTFTAENNETSADNNEPTTDNNESAVDNNEEGDNAAATDDETSYAQEIERLNTKVAELEAALDEQKNRYLRAQADLENFRRRTRKEKEDMLKYASQPVITALLPALDNLERAIEASRTEASQNDGLVKGVEMVYRQILDILGEEGLKEIPAVGEPFNPEFHEAVMQEESNEYESGIVTEQFQKGYQLKDRVIRPSMVKVAK